MDFQDLLYDTGCPGPRNITVEDVVKHVFDDSARVTLGLRVETLQRCWNAMSQAICAVSGEGRLQHIVHVLEEERTTWSMELSVKRKLLDMTDKAIMLHGVLDEFANICVYDSD